MSLNPRLTDWRGQRVWLIGASSGIGEATAATDRGLGVAASLEFLGIGGDVDVIGSQVTVGSPLTCTTPVTLTIADMFMKYAVILAAIPAVAGFIGYVVIGMSFGGLGTFRWPLGTALVWAIRHPARGVLEADDLDFDECLAVAGPYLGPLVGAYTEWTPLQGRGGLFEEDLDPDRRWQLRNVRARQWRA